MNSLVRDGVRLAYEDAGSGQPALLFVHGWGCDHSYFSPQVQHFGTRHHESAVSADLARELPRVIGLLDEPCADPAMVPAHLIARAASEHVTVVLSGTGGDELFGGYRRHRLPELLARLAWLPPSFARAGARALGDGDQRRDTVAGERMVMARKLLEARGRGPFLDAYRKHRQAVFVPLPASHQDFVS